jgi:hypothetical protein
VVLVLLDHDLLRAAVDGHPGHAVGRRQRVRPRDPHGAGSTPEVRSGQLPFDREAKNVLDLALRESLSLGHTDIGTEHILLGLVHLDEGVAVRILLDFDADAEKIRDELMRLLSAPRHQVDVPLQGARRGLMSRSRSTPARVGDRLSSRG